MYFNFRNKSFPKFVIYSIIFRDFLPRPASWRSSHDQSGSPWLAWFQFQTWKKNKSSKALTDRKKNPQYKCIICPTKKYYEDEYVEIWRWMNLVRSAAQGRILITLKCQILMCAKRKMCGCLPLGCHFIRYPMLQWQFYQFRMKKELIKPTKKMFI